MSIQSESRAEARTAVLGGETRERSMLGAPWWQIVTMVVLGFIWIVLLVVIQSPVMLFGALIPLVVWVLMRKVDPQGDSYLGKAFDRLWFAITGKRRLARFGSTNWQPGAGLPVEVGSIRELVWNPDGHGPELAFVHHKHREKSWGPDSSLTATLEVIGGGEGLREIVDTNRRAADFGGFLAGMASAQMATDAVEIETRVLPSSPEAYRTYQDNLLSKRCLPLVRESMNELASWSAVATETYRSFVTVRMNLGALQEKCVGNPDQDELVATAADELREIALRLDRAGMPVRGLLGPRRLGALIRHVYVPDFSIDDTSGIDSVLDGWSWPYDGRHHDGVRVDGPDGPWWHAVASVPRDAWPMGPVQMRWLEGLVTDVDSSAIRTVKATHRLVPPREARERARLALTYDTADMRTQERKGAVSTGESEASASVADQVLADVLHHKSGGDLTSLRFMVSARSYRELRQARSALERSAETDARINRLRWFDRRHHQAMLLAAPLARGLRR